jgi:hypothetical protein
MENNQSGGKDTSWWLRNLIALIITGFVLIGTILICIYSLFITDKPDFTFVSQSLLPLWATWIGTVLAFYFGKANFEAASKSYQDVIKALTPDEKIAKLMVAEVMIPVSQIEHLVMEDEINKTISEILKYTRFEKFNRFAIFDKSNVLRYIIHRSTFYQYIALNVDGGKDINTINALKLQDLLNETKPEIRNVIAKGSNFVAKTANLLDAKKAMDAIPECQDVFITETGKSTEPVLGLITNNMILDKAKV